MVGVAVGEGVDAGVHAAEDDGAAVGGRLDLDGVDRARLVVEQHLRQRRRVRGELEGPGEVVAAAGGDQAEYGAGAAEGAADSARDAVPADGEHNPALLSRVPGEFLGVGEAAAVLGPQLGARLAQQPGHGEQRGG